MSFDLFERRRGIRIPHDIFPSAKYPPVISVAIIVLVGLCVIVDPYLNFRLPSQSNSIPPLTEAEEARLSDLQFHIARLQQNPRATRMRDPSGVGQLSLKEAETQFDALKKQAREHEALEPIHPFTLHLGKGLQPVQWFTAPFLHSSYVALLFNLYMLWMMGLIVEGKLGRWKFGLLFLLLEAISNGLIQWNSLGVTNPVPPMTCGMTTIIFLLMGIAFFISPSRNILIATLTRHHWRDDPMDDDVTFSFQSPFFHFGILLGYGFILYLFDIRATVWVVAPMLGWFALGMAIGAIISRLNIPGDDEPDLVDFIIGV
ncbi:rhomboid family intramembrane serine protease [Bremerella sp. JC817]|uniref:rhomboid family intramembrane serine protease n=1 Tax=Bremerella sp. JC817 TaxID=3231756 RepID=UPI003457F3C7